MCPASVIRAGRASDGGTLEAPTAESACAKPHAPVAPRSIRVQGQLFDRPTRRQIADEEPEFFLENVTCAIYPRGEDPGRQVTALQRAFAKLAP